MKVSELNGRLLDAWVARAEGHNVATIKQGSEVVGYQLYYYSGDTPPLPEYSTDWADGGPIIERNGLEWERQSSDDGMSLGWLASIEPTAENRRPPWQWGETQLIAAMRAYVASKFGSEVMGEV